MTYYFVLMKYASIEITRWNSISLADGALAYYYVISTNILIIYDNSTNILIIYEYANTV